MRTMVKSQMNKNSGYIRSRQSNICLFLLNSPQGKHQSTGNVGCFFNAHLVNLLNKLESSTMSLDSSICIVFISI